MISTTAVHNATADTTGAPEHRGVRTAPAPPADRTDGAGGAQTSAQDRGDRVSLSAEGLARSRRQPHGSAASEPDRASRGGSAFSSRSKSRRISFITLSESLES